MSGAGPGRWWGNHQDAINASQPNHRSRIKTTNGRVRRCISQEGNAFFYLSTPGLANDRAQGLAGSLQRWQWPREDWR